MYFNTFKVSSYYRDHGVLGLDGFSGLTEFKFDGVWNSVSKEEFLAFATRNPTLEIIDINVDQNQEANNILLKKTNLQIVRLRCSRRSNRQLSNCPGLRQHKLHSPLGQCKRRMTFSWFRHQQNIKYIWIQCDLKHSVQKLLDFLPLLKNLKILHLDDAEGFKKEDFFKILEISPSLEVLGLPRGFTPEEDFWISLLDTHFGDRLREVYLKFVKCSLRLPPNIDLLLSSLPVKLTLIEVD